MPTAATASALPSTVNLNGKNLTLQQVIAVACHQAKVTIDTSNLAPALDFINKAVANKKVVYGVTTGFGSKVDTSIDATDDLELQVNLLRSHACGVGEPFSEAIVRAIMVIRLNTLLIGHSGVQQTTVQQLAFLLNHNILPVIPQQGSVGASGDLCPLSHMALPLIGEGEIHYKGVRYATSNFIAQKILPNFKPVTLSYKEGLALNNGTTVIAAVAVIALHEAKKILNLGTYSAALIFESLGVRKEFFDFDAFHHARKHSGQTAIAKQLKNLLKRSKLVGITQTQILQLLLKHRLIPATYVDAVTDAIQHPDKQLSQTLFHQLKTNGEKYTYLADIVAFARKKWKPQDSYSVRCFPQVFGASKTAIDHAEAIIANELNAAVDNPLIFAKDNEAISGGNFHGQPLALPMDYLKLAIAEMGNIVERQINKMMDANNNDCLPSFLVEGVGLNSGLMITQYVAASLVSENKVLVHPASADSIPTCENTEDHVSMGTIAARQALEIAQNVKKIIAIAVLTGRYAVEMRMSQFAKAGLPHDTANWLSPQTFIFYKAVAETHSIEKPTQTDRFLTPEIEKIMANFDFDGKLSRFGM